MTDTSALTAREVVQSIFQELAGDRASRLSGDVHHAETGSALGTALAEERSVDTANAIAFHLTDWNAEAAFIVALHLFPERFTSEQMRQGTESFLIHAPNHIAAAAHLAGWPVSDVFEVGVGGEDNETQAQPA
jgi:hypothetical protein